MGRIEKSIIIKAPPEKVWEMLALDRLTEWEEGCERVEYTSEIRTPKDKYRVGASTRTHLRGVGTIDFEIMESLENETITYRMIGKRTYNTIVTYALEPFEGGTKFAYMLTYELPWGILGKFVEKLFQIGFKMETEKSLEKLKSILEK